MVIQFKGEPVAKVVSKEYMAKTMDQALQETSEVLQKAQVATEDELARAAAAHAERNKAFAVALDDLVQMATGAAPEEAAELEALNNKLTGLKTRAKALTGEFFSAAVAGEEADTSAARREVDIRAEASQLALGILKVHATMFTKTILQCCCPEDKETYEIKPEGCKTAEGECSSLNGDEEYYQYHQATDQLSELHARARACYLEKKAKWHTFTDRAHGAAFAAPVPSVAVRALDAVALGSLGARGAATQPAEETLEESPSGSTETVVGFCNDVNGKPLDHDKCEKMCEEGENLQLTNAECDRVGLDRFFDAFSSEEEIAAMKEKCARGEGNRNMCESLA